MQALFPKPVVNGNEAKSAPAAAASAAPPAQNDGKSLPPLLAVLGAKSTPFSSPAEELGKKAVALRDKLQQPAIVQKTLELKLNAKALDLDKVLGQLETICNEYHLHKDKIGKYIKRLEEKEHSDTINLLGLKADVAAIQVEGNKLINSNKENVNPNAVELDQISIAPLTPR